MISFAVKNLARAAAQRPASLCLPILRSCSGRSLHVIPTDTRLLETDSLENLPSRCASFNFMAKATQKSRLNYTELHVWMLMLRCMQEGDEGCQVRNYMVSTMWEDVQARSKKLEHPNASLIKKQLKTLSEEFNASIVGYDETVQLSDSGLAGHLWRRFFSCEKVSPLLLEKLVHYIRRQLFMLSHVPRADLINMSPRIKWVYI